VRSEVVYDDQLTGFQLRAQNVFQVGEEDIPVGGGFYRHDRHPAGEADCSQYGQGAPMAGGDSFVDARAVCGTPVTPGHFRRDAAFVDEDELRRVDVPRFSLPELALRLDSFAVLFGGAE
jgi:hypothetical protein